MDMCRRAGLRQLPHHGLALSGCAGYRMLLDFFRCAHKVLLTATPYRGDGKALRATPVHRTTIKEAIQEKYIKASSPVEHAADMTHARSRQLISAQLTCRNGMTSRVSVVRVTKAIVIWRRTLSSAVCRSKATKW